MKSNVFCTIYHSQNVVFMYNYSKRKKGLIMYLILFREKKACRNRSRSPAALEEFDVLVHYETERDVPF